MSVIDCFKYYHIGNYGKLPIYVPRYTFNYLGIDVNQNNIIIGDDSASALIILNLRKVFISFLTWSPEMETNEYFNTIKSLNPDNYIKIPTWFEPHFSYEDHYDDIEKFLELKKKDTDIDSEITYKEFVQYQIALFIIEYYPKLLTNEEEDVVLKLKSQRSSKYIQKIDIRSEGLSSSDCELTL